MNLENKENLSNYQLLKRKPSLCSTSLPFSKLITVVQFFFPATPILIWYQLNFGAGNFRGRRPGTSALRMLLRLTAVFPAVALTSATNLVPRAHVPFGQHQDTCRPFVFSLAQNARSNKYLSKVQIPEVSFGHLWWNLQDFSKNWKALFVKPEFYFALSYTHVYYTSQSEYTRHMENWGFSKETFRTKARNLHR